MEGMDVYEQEKQMGNGKRKTERTQNPEHDMDLSEVSYSMKYPNTITE